MAGNRFFNVADGFQASLFGMNDISDQNIGGLARPWKRIACRRLLR